MVHPIAREPFSYRLDPAVPDFDDSGPVVFMDGDCALCSLGARVIARLDRRGEFRICPIKTDLGAAILAHYGLAPRDPATWLYLEDGKAHGSLDAMIAVGRRTGGVGRLLAPLRLLPLGLRNWLYRRIALNRYALFGRARLCELPDPGLRARLLR